MLRLFRVLQLQRKRPHTEDNADDFIRLQVANLALTILTVLFISTGLVYSLVDEDPSSFSSDHKLYWHDCFYFIVGMLPPLSRECLLRLLLSCSHDLHCRVSVANTEPCG
jgi:hypothetical protein